MGVLHISTERKMMDDITTTELKIEGENFRSGTSSGRRLVPVIIDGDEQDERALELTQRAIKKLRTGEGIKHRLDDEGDRLTLGELLERNGLTVDDIEREHRLSEFDPTTLSVGDVVEVERLHNGDPGGPKRGVVREIKPAGDFQPARAEIVWDNGRTWSTLRNDEGELRVGRGNMMQKVYDIRVVDAVDASEDLIEIRERLVDSKALDERASELDVEVKREWTESGGEADRATDRHARVTVSGGPLDEPVTVHCRNIFDAGWTATVEADLDEETEALVTRAARNNSPIPTAPRL